jgi:hypothetical protein
LQIFAIMHLKKFPNEINLKFIKIKKKRKADSIAKIADRYRFELTIYSILVVYTL